MISLFDADVDSSDSEDIDYVPSKTEADLSEASADGIDSESNDEDTEENGIKSSKKHQTRKRKSVKNEMNDVKKAAPDEKPKTEKLEADCVWKSFLEEVNTKNGLLINKDDVIVDKPKNTYENGEKCQAENSLAHFTSSENEVKVDNCTPVENIEVYEFAGETVAVKDGDSIVSLKQNLEANSPVTTALNEGLNIPNGKPLENPLKTSVKRKGGLNNVLGAILNKKQKMTTLQKTLIDWRMYKKEEDIDSELQAYNRGKGNYLERQRFLERSDVRRYEIEKAARLSTLKKKY